MHSLCERTTTREVPLANGEGALEGATHLTFLLSTPHHTAANSVGAPLKIPSLGGVARSARVGLFPRSKPP